MKTIVPGILFVLLVVSAFTGAFNVQSAKATAIIIVPDDYPTIDAAVNAASPGDSVYVRSGTYSVNNLEVSTSLSLVGENVLNTIIDGGGWGNILRFTVDNINMTGFTLWNGGGFPLGAVALINVSHCNLYGNSITDDANSGVDLFTSSDNSIVGNNITSNGYGVHIEDFSCSNNVFYHNNFVGNTVQVTSGSGSTNVWDNGYPSGGNYWSNYTGIDVYKGPAQNETGNDGIGDTPHVIDSNNTDNYPLMQPWSTPALSVTVSPSSTVTDVGQSQLFSSNVSGGTSPYTYQWYLNGAAVSGATNATWTLTPGSNGSYSVYVNVTDNDVFTAKSNIASATVNPMLSVSILPTSVTLNASQSQLFTPTVSGGTSPYSTQWYLNSSAVPGATNTTWTFTPTSAGSYTVYVNVTDGVDAQATSNTSAVTASPAIPEFPSFLILPLFVMATLLAAFVLKRKRNTKTQSNQPPSAVCACARLTR